MSVENKSNEEAQISVAGYNGTSHISGTSEKVCNCIGFEAWEDSVINAIKTDATTDVTTTLGWDSVTIPKGFTVWFGLVAYSVKLTSGSGQLIKSE